MIRINLLPVKQAKKRGAGQREIVLFVLILVGMGLLLYSIYNSGEQRISVLQKKKADIQAEMKRLSELIGDINTIQAKKKNLQKKLGIIQLLQKGKSGPVRVLDELSTVIPKKVWLKDLVQSKDALKMTGFATDNKEIAVFMKNLESSKYFQNVVLVSITQSKDKSSSAPVMSFAINCKYKLPRT